MSQFSYKKYESSLSSPRNKLWIEKEQKNLLIQSRFSMFNQSVLQKVQSANNFNKQIASSKEIIAAFENKVDKSLMQIQAQTNQKKEKLQSLSKRVNEIQRNHKQTIVNINKKIKQLRSKVNIELIRQKYASQNSLIKLQQDIEKIIGAFKRNRQINDSYLKEDMIKQQTLLISQTETSIKQSETLKRENQFYLENIADELQKKITDWKKRMVNLQHAQKEMQRQLIDHLNTAKLQIQQELKNEREIREQNKEKILMLLQVQSQKRTNKSK